MFNDQRFKYMLTNDIVSFEQLGPGIFKNSLGEMANCAGSDRRSN